MQTFQMVPRQRGRRSFIRGIAKTACLTSSNFLPNFFLFSLLLSLSVCSTHKYCLYFEMAKLKSENRKKQRNQSLVGLTHGPHKSSGSQPFFGGDIHILTIKNWRHT
jgi:hypothetical protein